MDRKDFYYDLPQELIAQTPAENRDQSRLLIYNMQNKQIIDSVFHNVLDYIQPNDCLIVNNSKVIPARLFGEKEGGGAHVEIFLLNQKQDNVWEVMVRPGKRLKPGAVVNIGEGRMRCEILEVIDGGNRLAHFDYQGNFYELLDEIGNMPLPPYITEHLQDNSRYQTVYAENIGSAAAPTAGLHFTDDLLCALKNKGVGIGYVTLHIGLGTFRPVKVNNITDHKMHTEHYVLPQETVDLIKKTKENGGRVIAVGTTSCRTLEGVVGNCGQLVADSGSTDIFIYPGYKFQVVDALITNFHLPESTLLMLISALVGRDEVMRVYEHAIRERYRFFSFGDACFFV